MPLSGIFGGGRHDTTASTPTLTVTPASGSEDTAIALGSHITAALTDTDGSESLAIKIAGVPTGATLSAGTNNGSGTWTLTPAQLAGLTITPPKNADAAISLTVTATSTESNGGATASKSATLAVQVAGVADAPTLAVSDTHGAKNTAIALGSHITAALTDTDGSETLAIKIAGVPSGATLSAGTNNGSGNWTVTPAQLASLTITPPSNSTSPMALSISAVSTEDNATTATTTKALTVTIDSPADTTASTPTLTVTPASGNEDTAIALGSHITAALTDTDGSETLAIKIAGVPTGATLSAGTNNGSGTWTLTPAQLAGLTITPPSNSDAAISLTVTATSTESNGGATASKSATLAVQVTGVADAPTLTVADAHDLAGKPISLAGHITAALTDTDGSEHLAIQIGSVPTGAVLSAGTNNGGGSWTLTPAQLANLTITPPANATTPFSLSVQAISTEDNGTTATVTKTLNVTIDPVAQAPSLTASPASGPANTAIPLTINAQLVHPDPGETLAVTIGGVPTGATLNHGTNQGNGTWALTSAQLTGLTITLPAGTTSPPATTGTVLTVGPGSQFATLAAAIAASHDGDTIQVQAGTYTNDFATINTKISLVGVGGMVHLVATGDISNGKAILITNTDVTISNFEFSGAQVSDGNGAGIRYQAGNLTLNNCYFHDNQEGLLAADNPAGSIVINTSEFAHNGVSDPAAAGYGTTHNIYVGQIGSLTIDDSYFHDAAVGHEIKSRALITTIQDSRIVDGTAGTASYSIDLPNGGNAIIKNNVIEQGPQSQNPVIIAFGEEGSVIANSSLQVTGNTILNDLASSSSRAVNNLTTASAQISGNQFFGLTTGQIAAGPNVQSNNVLLASEPTLDTSHPWSTSQGPINLTVTATAAETDGSVASTSVFLPVTVGTSTDTTASTPTLTVTAASGNEDTAIALGSHITAALTDTDGSETLAIKIAGVPTGATLSAGTNNGSGTWTLTPAQLANLTITPPSNSDAAISLTVTATSTESSGGATASKSATLAVQVTGVADAPTLTVSDTHGAKNTAIALGSHITAALTDTDGSETLAIKIAGVPTGATLSAGTNNGGGIWTLTPAQVATLTITPPSNSTTPIALTVSAVSTEDNATTATTAKTLNVTIDSATDTTASTPTLTVTAASGNEDTAIALGSHITAALTDTDGSETLAIKIAGVPTGATLSAGTNNGSGTWTLTPAQLANLTITPPSNSDAAISLTVTATSTESNGGATASKSATLAVQVTGVADAPTLTVSDTHGPTNTAIALGSHITAALTDTDGSETLAIKIAGVPTGATLSAGTNNGGGTWTLTPAQVANLTITPPSNSTTPIALTVSAVSTEDNATTATTAKTLTVAIDSPTQTTGNVVGFQLQNNQSTTLAAHEITFGQVFAPGQVPQGGHLVAVINGVQIAVQLDVKTTNADGSVKMGIITLDAPAIPANTTLSAMLALTTNAQGPSVDISKLPTSGYNTTVDLTVHNANGTNTAYHLDAGALLAQALKNGTVSYWMQGPQATEVRVDAPISGSLHVTFDITSFADGTSRTDVQFNNDYALQAVGGEVKYDATIKQNGSTVLQQNNVDQFQYQTWHKQIWSNGTPQVNIQHDIAALEKTGAIHNYDLSIPVDPSAIAYETTAMAAPGWGGVLAANAVEQYMPTTGGRGDIGPTTGGNAVWLVTQSQAAAQFALGQADAAGSVPWHLFDPKTGLYTSLTQYPSIWTDPRGGNGPPDGLTQQIDPNNASGWVADPAHQPDLSYVAYLMTGDRYYLDQLNAQADFDILSAYPPNRQNGLGLVANGLDQVREQAWDLRQIDEAAWANPDGSAEKAYFTQIANNNWHYLVSQLPIWTAQEGQAYGYIPGTYGSAGWVQMAPWQQDYFASAVIAAAEQGNQDAVQVLKWESNFLVGRFLNAANGFDPHDGVAYNLDINTANGTPYQTWAAIEQATVAAGDSSNGVFHDNDYAQLALMSLAGIITVTGSTDAMQAYGWLIASGAPGLTAETQFNIAPRLPDGIVLQQSQIQIDTSSSNVTLTANGGDSLLHGGAGNDTLVGGTGTVDLLFGGTGTSTLKAGTGNDYLFGGTGNNTFVDNIGNNFMKGGPKANIYVFNEAHSGHDTIANFNAATDQLQITHNLNGDGIATVADAIATATVSNGNTILHLGPQDDITLLGIASPSVLSHAIVIV